MHLLFIFVLLATEKSGPLLFHTRSICDTKRNDEAKEKEEERNKRKRKKREAIVAVLNQI